ncbi:MAG: hypothetical protein NC831_02810 [Candidatus Omnitrophica bacterium]|nr:hypothetical protein [Candidatus Omnitrophota bacterium]
MQFPQKLWEKSLENELLVRLINEMEIKDSQMPEFISKFRQTKEEVIGGIFRQTEEEIAAKKVEEKIAYLDKLSLQLNDGIKKIRNDIMKSLSPGKQIKLALMMDDILLQLLKTPPVPPPQMPFIPDVSRQKMQR